MRSCEWVESIRPAAWPDIFPSPALTFSLQRMHAQTLGLVDKIGTLDDVVRENFPVGVAVKELSRPGRGRMLFNTAADAFAQSLVNAAARAGHLSIN